MLLEKAWAKVCGTYARTIAGQEAEGLRFLTGAPCQYIEKEDYGSKALWDLLMEADSSGYAICGGAGQETKKKTLEKAGLFASHAYTVIGVYDVEVERLVKIRNPHGSGEWTGKWSDQDDENWTSEIK